MSEGSTRDGGRPHIWVAPADPRCAGDAVRWSELLRAAGADVGSSGATPPGRPVDAVVLVLPDGPPLDPPVQLDLTGIPADRVVPLAPGARASAATPSVSQLVVGVIGERRATARVLAVARLGGPALAELYQLRAAADGWAGSGRPRSKLLGARDTEDAVLLLSSPSVHSLAGQSVPEYVTASSQLHRGRRRRDLVVVLVVALVLSSVSAAAFVLRAGAGAAAERRDSEQATSDSVRLAGLAVDALGIDPDLPWLLADEALDAGRTPEALSAARRVLASSPPHSVVPLPDVPDGLTADPGSDTVVLTYLNGTVEVRSGADGALRTSWQRAGNDPVVANVSPGGQWVAEVGPGTVIRSATAGDVAATLPADDVFRGWVDGDHVLVSTGGVLRTVDVVDGTTGPDMDPGVPLDPGPAPWSAAPGDGWTHMLVDDQVLAVRASTGEVLDAFPLAPGAEDIATSPDGQQALVTFGDGSATLVVHDGGSLVEGLIAPGVSEPTAFGDLWLMGRSSTGQVVVARADQRAPVLRAVVSRGPVAGLGPLSETRFATVGGDRALRLWDLAGTPSMLTEGTGSADLLDRDAGWHRESGRPMVEFEAGTGSICYTLQSPAIVGRVDADSLEPVGLSAYLGDITISTRTLPGCRLSILRDSGSAQVVDVLSGLDDWDRDTQRTWRSSSSSNGASADGSRLAVADLTALVSIGATGEVVGPVEFDGFDYPVAVLVDEDGRASAVGASGTRRHEDGSVDRVVPDGLGAVAATTAPGGGVLVVSTAGELLRVDDTGSTTVATLPAGFDAFALHLTGDDDELLAVIGERRTQVLRLADGHPVLDLPAVGGAGSAVRDLVVHDGHSFEIRADDSITRRAVLDDAQVAAAVAEHVPRALTDAERDAVREGTLLHGGE